MYVDSLECLSEADKKIQEKLRIPGFKAFLYRQGHVPEYFCAEFNCPDLDALEKEFWEEQDRDRAEQAAKEAAELARKKEEQQREMVAAGLWSTRQAAEFLGVSVDFVRDRIRNGELPHTTIGRGYRVPRRALENYAMKHLTVR